MFLQIDPQQSRLKHSFVGWGIQALAVCLFLAFNAFVVESIAQPKRDFAVNVVNLEAVKIHYRSQVAHESLQRNVVASLRIPLRVIQMRDMPRFHEIEVVAPQVLSHTQPPLLIANTQIPRGVITDVFNANGTGKIASGSIGQSVKMGAFGAIDGVAHGKSMGGVSESGFDLKLPTPLKDVRNDNFIQVAPTSPVEILTKPRPIYTDEARKMKIEGLVKLQIRFTAQGHVIVLSTVKSLGFGLDEQAAKAVREIKFKPAQQGGRNVDQLSTLSVLFQLT